MPTRMLARLLAFCVLVTACAVDPPSVIRDSAAGTQSSSLVEPVETVEPAAPEQRVGMSGGGPRLEVVLTDVSELVDVVADGVVAVSRGQFRLRIEDLLEAVEVPAGVGTGIVIDDEGHILTNYHVVENAEAVTVTLRDGTDRAARIIGEAPDFDLALLSVEDATGLEPISLGSSDALDVGDPVVAIAIDSVDDIIVDFLSGEGAPHLGVQLIDNSPQVASQMRLTTDSGAVIAGVTAGPASTAGIRPGDVVIGIGDQRIVDADALADAIAAMTPGSAVELTVLRGVDHLVLSATIGSRPVRVDR